MQHIPLPANSSLRHRRRALILVVVAVTGVLAALGRMEILRLSAAARVLIEGGRLLDRQGVVLQKGLHDCGPAALATLMRLSGGSRVPLDSIASLAGTSSIGTSASGLVDAALELGFQLSFTRLPGMPGPDLGPFIAWVRSSHFVVVRVRPDGRVLVHDPQVGRYLLERDDFEGIWTGESLVTAVAVPRLTTLSEPESPARVIATGRLP